MPRKNAVDPNKVAWISPQALSLQADRYIAEGEYRILEAVEEQGGVKYEGRQLPGILIEKWGGRATIVTISDADGNVTEEFYEVYDGPDDEYVPRRTEEAK